MFPFVFTPRKFISHTLILISVIITCISFIFPQFLDNFGFHGGFGNHKNLLDTIAQICLFQFIHGNILHLFMNSYFLYTAGVQTEGLMSQDRFISFFVTTTVFIVLGLMIFASPWSNTIGISGFCMALLSYLWMELSSIKHPGANQILIMLILNIAIGLAPGISFVGHFVGAIWGLIWWKTQRYSR